MSRVSVAIIGAGPYGLSLAAHLAARRVDHRIFGRPMQFWDAIAATGGERYLKSYCFGTNISVPAPGSSFADYSAPRGLETFEPCSIANFAAYGHWFQRRNVSWVEPVDVTDVMRNAECYTLTLADGERLVAERVVVATGLGCFDNIPPALASLPATAVIHTSKIANLAAFAGRDVAVVGAGQSALEAAALLREAGARPRLVIRGQSILWHTRVSQSRSLWRRLRSPISGLGTGPKAWALTRFPGALRRAPAAWRTRFVRRHLPAEGAWWLRNRVEGQVPVHVATNIVEAREATGRVALRLRNAVCGNESQLTVDHVIAGTGYDINVDRLEFLGMGIRCAIDRLERSPSLSAAFELIASRPPLRRPSIGHELRSAVSFRRWCRIHRERRFQPSGINGNGRAMTLPLPPVIVLPGAGGGTPDLAMFGAGFEDATFFQTIAYPGWQRYVEPGFSADALVEELAAEIAVRVPEDPIRIVGISLGGHLGYATALRLQARGREIGGFCAVDTFMMSSSAASAGWINRALVLAVRLVRDQRFDEFGQFLRSRFWRALLRLWQSRITGLFRSYAASGKRFRLFALDPLLEKELSMRLLIQHAAPFVASLDRDLRPLDAPTILLRTEFTGRDDAAWRRRCPHIKIVQVPGDHQTLFEQAGIGLLREAFVTATKDWR